MLATEAFVLRFIAPNKQDRLLLVNLGADLRLDPAPEPLLAPPVGSAWRVLWSSEDTAYVGGGTPPVEEVDKWYIVGLAAVLLAPKLDA